MFETFFGCFYIFFGPVSRILTFNVVGTCKASIFVCLRRLDLSWLLIHQCFDDSSSVLSKVVRIVAAFQDDYHFRADLKKFMSHPVIAKWTDVGATELIMDGRVEAA